MLYIINIRKWGDYIMSKKIIELSNIKQIDYKTCLLCCDNIATAKFTINRVKYDDTVTSFNICSECLAKMQKDIEICE